MLNAAPLMIGYLVISFMVAFRPDERGYHDLLARTCVVIAALARGALVEIGMIARRG